MTSVDGDSHPRRYDSSGGGGHCRPTPNLTAVDKLDARTAMLARAGRGDYWRWLAHVQTAAACTRPVRLAGTVHTVNTATGELVESRATADMPDAVIYKACGNRRAAVCPACAEVYRADAYQLVLAGLRGGKGIPESVAGHPAVFATLTAPSFGLVHSQRRRNPAAGARPCRPRRTPEVCRHGRDLTCRRTHTDDDPRLGQAAVPRLLRPRRAGRLERLAPPSCGGAPPSPSTGP